VRAALTPPRASSSDRHFAAVNAAGAGDERNGGGGDLLRGTDRLGVRPRTAHRSESLVFAVRGTASKTRASSINVLEECCRGYLLDKN